MDYIFIILGTTLIVSLIWYLYHKYRIKKEFNSQLSKLTQQLNNEKEKKLEEIEEEWYQKRASIGQSIREANERLAAETDKVDTIINQQKEIIAKELDNYRITESNRINSELSKQVVESKLKETELADLVAEHRRAANIEITKINNELDSFRAKRAAINEEIIRQRKIAEEENFYRIKLTDADKNDINYLLSIITNIKNKDVLYKLIWSEYIQKPFNQVIKNVLGSTPPKNVIYMIRNIKTNEVYIGKTKQEVSKRWIDHIKTSLNIGSQTPKKIHKALYNHWDEFTFELLEVVPEYSDLGERESYYINLYESNIYGYNMIK